MYALLIDTGRSKPYVFGYTQSLQKAENWCEKNICHDAVELVASPEPARAARD